MARTPLTTTCCIAGGGPAGMMLGLLLARADIPVIVLEKHKDFLRDFRGDTIHPSTLELMHELGLLDDFLRLPHQKVTTLTGQVGEETIQIADFRHLPTRCKFVALMPQWDFLDFLADAARHYKTFSLHLETEVTGLIEEGGRVAGVSATTRDGPLQIRAELVVGADGRRSTVRQGAGLKARSLGAPMDVLWFRISRREDDPDNTFGHIEAGRMMVMLNRGDYWQCAYVIAKGGFDAVKAGGLAALRDSIAALSPFVRDRMTEIRSWDDVKLLSVGVDRLARWWRPGVLCIGDAAHTMSPIGGVGINLAIQDAVAAANILVKPLSAGKLTVRDLAAVQKRRRFPVRFTQRLQVAIQNNVIAVVLKGGAMRLPWPLRLLRWFPVLQRLPARLVGIGIRPEHVRTPEAIRPER